MGKPDPTWWTKPVLNLLKMTLFDPQPVWPNLNPTQPAHFAMSNYSNGFGFFDLSIWLVSFLDSLYNFFYT